MAKIRVTRGSCGIRYTDANGTVRFKTLSASDGSVECEDTQAARLVRLGAAKYCGEEPAAQETPAEGAAQEEGAPDEEPAEETQAEEISAEQLKMMTNAELAAFAEEHGIDVSGCRKKDDYVSRILEGLSDDDLPDLDAADPV